MPRFFIDTDDTVRSVTDEYGSELADLDAAKRLASKTLSEMMADSADALDASRFSAVVRNELGAKLFTAHLTLSMDPTE